MLDEPEFARVNPLLNEAVRQIKAYRQEYNARLDDLDLVKFYGRAIDEYEALTGYRESNPEAIRHHRIAIYGTPCRQCGKILRTPKASKCFECGASARASEEELSVELLKSNDPAVVCRALHELRRCHPRAALLREIEGLLKHKFQSVQSMAGQLLAAWKSRESLPVLLDWFDRHLSEPRAQDMIGVAARCIAAVMKPQDTPMLIRRFLDYPTYSERYEFLPVVRATTSKVALPILRDAWTTADRDMKHSILVAATYLKSSTSDRILQLGARDEDDYIRELSEVFLRTRPWSEWVKRWQRRR